MRFLILLSEHVDKAVKLLKHIDENIEEARRNREERQAVLDRLGKLTPPHVPVCPPTEDAGNCFFDALKQLIRQPGVTHHNVRAALCQFVEDDGQVNIVTSTFRALHG